MHTDRHAAEPWLAWLRSLPVALFVAMLIFCIGTANAAFLQLTVSTSGVGPAAAPRVEVTVSGVVVFNQRTRGATIPINTTGSVSVRVRDLLDYQEFTGWGGVCAGVLASLPCDFGAGVDTGYAVGIGVRNRSGTLRFTSSSTTPGVGAPERIGLSILSAPDGTTGDLIADTRASASPLLLLAGGYTLQVMKPSSSTCTMSPQVDRVAITVSDGAETVVPMAFRAEDCLVNVDLLQADANGSVTSAPAGIDCPFGAFDPRSRSPCSAFFPFGSTVSLRAAPKPGFVFSGWGSGCGWALDSSCTTIVQASGSAKAPGFAAAAPGRADLAIVTSDLAVADAGGGRVRVSLTLRNRGPDAAAAVRAEMGPTLLGTFTELPNTVSDRGECTGSSVCRWTLGDLAAGEMRVVSFTAATTRTDFPLRACTLSGTPDTDGSNNCAEATATFGGVPPVVQGPATVALGPVPPADRRVLKGETDVVVLQFTARPPSPATSPHALVGLVLQASGSGDDQRDIVGVSLYPDLDGNGLIDAAERSQRLASARFDGNDGRARLDLAPSALGAGRNYLVALDLAATLAGAPVAVVQGSDLKPKPGAVVALPVLAAVLVALLGGLMWVRGGRPRRRTDRLACALALSGVMAGCGGDSADSGVVIAAPATERSYRVHLVEAVVSNGTVNVPATGTPLVGAEVRALK